VDYKLEVVVVPVSDVDRAKAFYADACGFHVDLDDAINDQIRLVQLTPPGSACSISIGRGISDAVPGSVRGIQLVVVDIDGARAELTGRGVDVGPVQHFQDGVWVDGKGGPWNSFARFRDPDGNEWVLQETPNK
jgi:catechol 2,3-dioxygenase-like lactoylglutathione lyase family enzyme